MGRLLKSISIRRPANLHTKICLKKKDKKLKICYLFWKNLMLARALKGNWQYFVMGYHEHIWFHQCQEDINSLYQFDLGPADFRRFLTVLVDRPILGSQCWLSMGLVANGIRLTKCCNALSLRSDVTHGLPDIGKSFTLLVCVCFLTSRLTVQNSSSPSDVQ